MTFSEPTIAPKPGTKMSPKIYNNLLKFKVQSLTDDSEISGTFGSVKKNRLLAASEVDGEAAKYSFVPTITSHNETAITT